MSAIAGSGQDLFWLNTANIVLGVVVAICLAVVAVGFARELQVRFRRRTATESEIETDMRQMLGQSHAFDVPGLGLTMADGGERVDKTTKNDRQR